MSTLPPTPRPSCSTLEHGLTLAAIQRPSGPPPPSRGDGRTPCGHSLHNQGTRCFHSGGLGVLDAFVRSNEAVPSSASNSGHRSRRRSERPRSRGFRQYRPRARSERPPARGFRQCCPRAGSAFAASCPTMSTLPPTPKPSCSTWNPASRSPRSSDRTPSVAPPCSREPSQPGGGPPVGTPGGERQMRGQAQPCAGRANLDSPTRKVSPLRATRRRSCDCRSSPRRSLALHAPALRSRRLAPGGRSWLRSMSSGFAAGAASRDDSVAAPTEGMPVVARVRLRASQRARRSAMTRCRAPWRPRHGKCPVVARSPSSGLAAGAAFRDDSVSAFHGECRSWLRSMSSGFATGAAFRDDSVSVAHGEMPVVVRGTSSGFAAGERSVAR